MAEEKLESLDFMHNWPLIIYGGIGGAITPMLGLLAKINANETILWGSTAIAVAIYAFIGGLFTLLKGERKIWGAVVFGMSLPAFFSSTMQSFSQSQGADVVLKAMVDRAPTDVSLASVELSQHVNGLKLRVNYADGTSREYPIVEAKAVIDQKKISTIEIIGKRIRDKKITIDKIPTFIVIEIDSSTLAAIGEGLGLHLPPFHVGQVLVK
jgi:hypothetical protein